MGVDVKSFKDKYPDDVIWHDHDVIMEKPEPYDQVWLCGVQELTTPDRQHTFLLAQQGICEERGFVKLFAVEAPRCCPVRYAFESGEMTWLDFWSNKGWLLHLTMPLFEEGIIQGEYVTPEEICQRTRRRFANIGSQSPFELKRINLEALWRNAAWNGGDASKQERDYQDFMCRNGHRFINRAAA